MPTEPDETRVTRTADLLEWAREVRATARALIEESRQRRARALQLVERNRAKDRAQDNGRSE